MVNEMSFLRAQVTELSKIIKRKQSKAAPLTETVELGGNEEIYTREEVQWIPAANTK